MMNGNLLTRTESELDSETVITYFFLGPVPLAHLLLHTIQTRRGFNASIRGYHRVSDRPLT